MASGLSSAFRYGCKDMAIGGVWVKTEDGWKLKKHEAPAPDRDVSSDLREQSDQNAIHASMDDLLGAVGIMFGSIESLASNSTCASRSSDASAGCKRKKGIDDITGEEQETDKKSAESSDDILRAVGSLFGSIESLASCDTCSTTCSDNEDESSTGEDRGAVGCSGSGRISNIQKEFLNKAKKLKTTHKKQTASKDEKTGAKQKTPISVRELLGNSCRLNPFATRDEAQLPKLGNEYVKVGGTWVIKGKSFLKSDQDKLSREERLLKLAREEEIMRHKELSRCSQPHVIVSKGNTKEQKVVISTSEALTRLDLNGAVKDVRRLNYVCRLLEHLIKHKLSSLSGTAQKILFNILEECVKQAITTDHNIRMVEELVVEMRTALKVSQYDHVGSSSLWAKHTEAVDRMQNSLNDHIIEQRKDDGKLTITDLPNECIYQILFRLADHKDLVHTGLTESRTYDLAEDESLWRDLCLYHFSETQQKTVLEKLGPDGPNTGWKPLYTKLVKRYGLKEDYGEMLHLCRHCNALYWNLHGHPCLVPDMKPESTPISPTACMELFNA